MTKLSKPSIVFWCPIAYVVAVFLALRTFFHGCLDEAVDAWDDLTSDFSDITRNTKRMWCGDLQNPEA